MSNDHSYWQKKHPKYAEEDWIAKPTIFATQAIKYFPKTGHILELGAGQGQDTIYFAKKDYKVTSCDISEIALDFAKKRLPSEFEDQVEFRLLDLSQPLPFESESFDIIYSHLALHYFDAKRTKELFEEIHNILKKGGVFATITNTVDDPEIPEFEKIEEDYYSTPDGIIKRYFSVDSMKIFTDKFQTVLLDAKGETHKDLLKTLIRYIGKKSR